MSIWEMVGLIAAYNLMTFGNGPVMVPLLQNGFVDTRGVLSQDQLLYAFTIARITPGQANVYVASIGYMLFGFVGALLTTLAIQLPGLVMIPVMRVFERFKGLTFVNSFTRGITATSVGLIFAAVVQIGRTTLTSWTALLVFAVTIALIWVFKLNMFVSLGGAVALGLLLYFVA